MSLVVSDAGPVHYLLLCGVIDVIPELFDSCVIPAAVLGELSHAHTPREISSWIQNLPSWAAIQIPGQIDTAKHLGLGEREAIGLAIELKANLLLMDDRAARRAAIQRGLQVAGTVGILERAAAKGLLNLPEVLHRLLRTNFRIKTEAVGDLLERDATRRRLTGSGE